MNTKPRILLYGDFFPTGFGRIVDAVAAHLNNSGQYDLMGACVQWDGILPLPKPQPFHVCGLSGRDQGAGAMGFAQVVTNIWGSWQPDVIISVQDFPYHDALRASPIDWSVTGHIVVTPIDGVPIDQRWITAAGQFDALLTISEFGQEALRQQGVRAGLCPPGVDTDDFHRLPDEQRAGLRDMLGLPRDAFVVGVMAMNQGRKDFPTMVAAFADAYRDVPNAYLYLDCEPVSPVGWNIPDMLLKPNRLDPARVKYRADALKAGVVDLNARYNLLNLHMVIAHREGYGLPHGEALATGCPTVTLDYCSGREIVGNNERGWLIPAKPVHPGAFGTWGGALDYWADMPALVQALREAHDNPTQRELRGKVGADWARTARQWSRAGQAVEDALTALIAKRGHDFDRKRPSAVPTQTVPMPQALNINGAQYVLNGGG